MARAQGARALMALAFETTYGTPPASGFTRMPFASTSLGAEQPLLNSELLGYGRDPLAPVKDAVTADGDVVVPLDAEALGFWLKAAFGAPTTTGAEAPYSHEFQSGSWTLPSMSIETGMPEVPRYATYSGCVLDQITWQMQRSGFLTATARLVAQGETVGTTTSAGTPAALELKRFGHFNGAITRNGTALDKKYIYRMLSNRAYIGEAVHKGDSYPGEHDAIIEPEIWDRVHAILQESPRKRAARTRADTPALLKGLLFGPDGAAFSPTHTRKGDRLYRYYVSQTVLKHGAGSCPVGRVPAGEIEAAVIDQLRAVFRQPEIVAGTWKAARADADDISEADAREALRQLDPLWDELFPTEQARIVALLVERVDIAKDGLNVRLRVDGLGDLAREMLAGDIGAAA